MWNIQPGTGLGFVASKEIALGLGTPFTTEEIIFEAVESAYSFIKALIMRTFIRGTVG